jgi:hypothetical protein
MNKPPLLFSLAIALASGGAAQAADDSGKILAAGSLYAGPSQAQAVCYIYNPGPDVNIVFMDIYDQNGVVLPLAIRQCGGTLSSGQSCGIAGDIANNSSYSCAARVLPNKDEVRGILEIRDANQNSLTNIEMR